MNRPASSGKRQADAARLPRLAMRSPCPFPCRRSCSSRRRCRAGARLRRPRRFCPPPRRPFRPSRHLPEGHRLLRGDRRPSACTARRRTEPRRQPRLRSRPLRRLLLRPAPPPLRRAESSPPRLSRFPAARPRTPRGRDCDAARSSAGPRAPPPPTSAWRTSGLRGIEVSVRAGSVYPTRASPVQAPNFYATPSTATPWATSCAGTEHPYGADPFAIAVTAGLPVLPVAERRGVLLVRVVLRPRRHGHGRLRGHDVAARSGRCGHSECTVATTSRSSTRDCIRGSSSASATRTTTRATSRIGTATPQGASAEDAGVLPGGEGRRRAS